MRRCWPACIEAWADLVMRKARPTDHRSHHSSTSTDIRVGTLLTQTVAEHFETRLEMASAPTDHVFPRLPVYHWVLSVPKSVRHRDATRRGGKNCLKMHSRVPLAHGKTQETLAS